MPSLFVGPLALLRRAPSFTLLFLATLGSGLGTGIAVIALTVDVYDRTGSGKWVAALLVTDFVPMLVIGLLLGPLLDRFSRKRVMIASDLIRFAVFAVLPFATGPAMIVVLAGVVGFSTGFFRPAVYAGMPNLVEERDLPQANSLFQSVENLNWLLGPVLGGILLSVWGPNVPYVFNAVTFLVSAALIARLPARLLQVAEAVSEGHWRDVARGFSVVVGSRALMTVLITWSVVMLANANVNVAEVALAKVSYGAGNIGLGVLMASAGVGLLLGSFVAGGWIARYPISRVYAAAIALMAAGIAAAAVAPVVWVGALCVVVSGFGNGIASVCNPTLVQSGAPDELRGRAFTVIMSVNAATLGLGMAIAGPLTDAAGARWAWGGAAAVYGFAAVLAFALGRGIVAGREEVPEPMTVIAAAAPQAVQPAEPA